MKILVSGCSYTEHNNWPNYLFYPKKHEVTNVGVSSAGNEYISNSVMYNFDKVKPDFVYILWSGINRSDLRVPNSSIFSNAKSDTSKYRSSELGESKFFLSGHALDTEKGWLAGYNNIKADDWPNINSLSDWFDLPEVYKIECLQRKLAISTDGGGQNLSPFCHQYYVTQNLGIENAYKSERTFQNLMNCFNFLDKLNVPYRFSFIYDLWNKDEHFTHGRAVKEKYYNYIDWNKFIDFPPYEFGIKYDLLDEDQYHLTDDGMNQWAIEITKILQKDKSLQHLF